jgi:hypothetical protein
MSSDSGNLSPSRSDLSFDEDKREKTWLLADFKDPQAVTYTRIIYVYGPALRKGNGGFDLLYAESE